MWRASASARRRGWGAAELALRHVEPNGPRPGGSGRRQARAACGTVRRRLAAGLRAEALEAAPEDLWRRFWPGQASGSFAGALRSARDPIPQERAAFVSWAVLGAPFGNLPPAVPAAPTPVGEAPRMLDIFLRVGRCGGGTPEGLLACRDARACQVLRTDPGRTAWLRDGFTDETFEVRFGAFSRRARAGDVEGVWLRPLAGVFDVCGLGWTLPPPDLEPQRRFGERHLERLRQVDPGLGWRAGRCREGSPPFCARRWASRWSGAPPSGGSSTRWRRRP